MTRYLIIPPPGRIMVKIVRLGKETRIIEYFESFGSVSKDVFTRTKCDPFNYATKDHKARFRAAKERIEKTKESEVC